MAMTKCKECGAEISTKAESCPQCGAKRPKKTSLFTWIIFGFIILFTIAAFTGSDNDRPATTTASSASSSSSAKPAVVTPPPKPTWQTSSSKDDMTGEVSAHAHSPSVRPVRPMGFPYSDVKAWLGVGCKGGREWAYIGFNEAPNLTGTDTEDGYNVVSTRIRWDDQVQNVVLTQDWGDRFLSFRHDANAINKIAASSSALLELRWYGESGVHFEFPLKGSSKALAEIRAKCR